MSNPWEESVLDDAMRQIGYKRELRSEKDLPNEKNWLQ